MKYRNEEWLRQKFVVENKTRSEISEICNVSVVTIGNWVDKFGLKKKYRQEEVLRELYCEKDYSLRETAEKLDCSKTAIETGLKKCGIETDPCSFDIPPTIEHHERGYEVFRSVTNGEKDIFLHHRLLAIAKFGFDSVTGSVVHHKNRNTWDNREENLSLFESQSEHRKHHIQIERETKFLAETLGLN